MSGRRTIPGRDYATFVIHRVLAGHRPHQECAECPFVVCRHCGDFGRLSEDHTCSCPSADADCPDHPFGGAA